MRTDLYMKLHTKLGRLWANVRWSDGSIGSIRQAILWSDKYFTGGEMTLLQNAREHSLEARGFASMPNVSWFNGLIGSIGQAILRSDKYFTDGEMTLLQNAREHSLGARGFASMPNVRWIDRTRNLTVGQIFYRW